MLQNTVKEKSMGGYAAIEVARAGELGKWGKVFLYWHIASGELQK